MPKQVYSQQPSESIKSGLGINPIPVGEFPEHIAIDPNTKKVYVTNSNSYTVSVIDPYFPKQLTEQVINVGTLPTDIVFDPDIKKVYVTNSGSNTVSVIDGTTDKVVNVTTVGKYPTGIAIDPDIKKVYVTNSLSNAVSLVNGTTDKAIVGVKFSINPSINAGNIVCDKDIPTNSYLYMEIGTQCKAEHNTGFQFSSWTENLGKNSTKNITPVTKISFWYTPIVNWFKSTVDALGLKIFQEDTSATFNVTQFGSFTANFDKVPPPLPPEYLAPLYGVIITTLVGSWFIPTAISWFKSKKQQGRLHHHIKTIDSLNSSEKSYKDNENKVLLEIQKKIADAYVE